MATATFEAPVDGGVLAGTLSGDGPPVLVLHGGPGLSANNVDGLVADLVPSYRTALFQQRGLAPSVTTGSFTIAEALSDVVAVLDHLGWDRAFLAGSSWGGHLALWAATQVPERLLGVLAVDPLGAVGDGGLADFETAMTARTPEDVRARAEDLDRRAQAGEASELLAAESFELFWPAYFAEPALAPPMPPTSVSVAAYSGLFADLHERFAELEAALPSVRVPVGLVLGAAGPMPTSAGEQTAARIPGAWVEAVPGAGHFPWHEVPGAVRQALDRLASHSSARSA